MVYEENVMLPIEADIPSWMHSQFDQEMNDLGKSFIVSENIEGHFYVEHNVKDIQVKVVEPQCIEMSPGTESSDNEGLRVRFDDTEDERTTAMDDGTCLMPMCHDK
ncbi:hypothetical protein KIW84_046450 [Lathyrus oleraceus]|uniref:Uncharacterized protein n=1 Tax=Pisum sativum TaxID=3888 RepID=A0A9D4XR27_PEA|nr:hypothetical protein KIW84_046450 [Pisum sativum]